MKERSIHVIREGIVMPKSQNLRRSLEINLIWAFDLKCLTINNKTYTYMRFQQN